MNRIFASAALVACGLLAAAPALAASSFNVSPPFVAGGYYEQNGTASCTDINACQIIFSKVPAGQTLTLERVTCSVEVHSHPLRSGNLVSFRSSSQGFERPQHLAPSLISKDSFNGIPVHFFSVDQSVRYPLGNASPRVVFFQTIGDNNSQFAMGCQISGTLSPLA
jgi:hypothetical protein